MQNKKSSVFLWGVSLVIGGALALATFGSGNSIAAKSTPSHAKAPKTEMRVPAGKEIATLAAGCFWSMEAIFEEIKGVESVEPGYAGGHVPNPSYERVCSETSGHAETVNIVFDPKQISYGELLRVMLTMRDPTTLNRQGPDVGESYRSAIFTHGARQQEIAQQVLREIGAKKVWNAPIVTKAEPFSNFYQAENYHRDYFRLNPNAGYSQAVIAPKIAQLHEKFPHDMKN